MSKKLFLSFSPMSVPPFPVFHRLFCFQNSFKKFFFFFCIFYTFFLIFFLIFFNFFSQFIFLLFFLIFFSIFRMIVVLICQFHSLVKRDHRGFEWLPVISLFILRFLMPALAMPDSIGFYSPSLLPLSYNHSFLSKTRKRPSSRSEKSSHHDWKGSAVHLQSNRRQGSAPGASL